MSTVLPKTRKTRGADLKVRVAPAMRQALDALAVRRYTTTSELVREALLDYLTARRLLAVPAPPDTQVADPK